MTIMICTYFNSSNNITEPEIGSQVSSPRQLPTTTTAAIEAGRMIGGDDNKHYSISRTSEGDLMIVSTYPGPFAERAMPLTTYVHIFLGDEEKDEEFEQLVDAVMAYQDRHTRPLFGENRELPKGTFAAVR